jgi:hypothetical protein
MEKVKDIANRIDGRLRDGYGVLYRANKRSAKAPDMRGSVTVAGVEYWLSAWTREGVIGRDPVHGEYLSLSLRRREP